MKELSLRNLSLMAAVAGCFTQIGAQLYALSVIGSTVSAAPPRSFAILAGEYRYDSSAFWDTAPPVVFALLVIALDRELEDPTSKFDVVGSDHFHHWRTCDDARRGARMGGVEGDRVSRRNRSGPAKPSGTVVCLRLAGMGYRSDRRHRTLARAYTPGLNINRYPLSPGAM